jgi:repressor LexA
MLTDSQRKTYQFICDFMEKFGYAPKLPEIAKGIGISSKGVAHRYVQALAKQGLLKLIPHRHRGIELTKQSGIGYKPLPLLGKIAAGQPILAVEDEQQLDLASMFSNQDLFALQVKGDSMIDAAILDGDIVLCQKQSVANNGDIVVALIDNQEATLKTFRQMSNGHIALIAANPSMPPKSYDPQRVKIQGVFKGLVRVTKYS